MVTQLTTEGKVLVTTEEVVDGCLKEELWGVYERSFEEIKEKHPCRQSLRRQEYDDFMADPKVIKFLVYQGNILVAGSFVTEDLTKIPWISAPFYDKQYPQYIGCRMYAQSFFVEPTNRARGHLQALARYMGDYLRDRKIKVCFCDFGGRNEILFSLINKAVRAHGLGTIDAQIYEGIVLDE